MARQHQHLDQQGLDRARIRHRNQGTSAKHSQTGDQFFGIHASNHGRVMIFAGGVPLKSGGQVVGAVGVSGGSGNQDQAVAEAAAAAFNS